MMIRILLLLIFSFTCSPYKAQNIEFEKFDLQIYSLDCESLDAHLIYEGKLLNSTDTIIVLVDKLTLCDQGKLEEASWEELTHILGVRIDKSSFYINDKLIFPLNKRVYFYNCEE